ncbi:hypothetical protein NHQ30_008922 [Ciborinia camelliae]|nr:hypothetical protein NHQ30_008922 [Ciborinia camelliae]
MIHPSFILLPLYIWPSPGAWDWVTTALSAHPTVNFTIIINPDSGPGPAHTFPDQAYIDGVASLNAFPNAKCLGYVDTAYMARSVEDVTGDVDTYKFWSTYTPQDIHLTGIFFDDSVATWDTTSSPYMSSIAAHAHAANLSVTLNPGTLADDGFFTIAENVVVVEDGFVGGLDGALSAAWDWVTTALSAHPTVNFTIIINPDSGPGPAHTFPDQAYIDGVASLNAFPNAKCLGYVDTAYMARSVEDVTGDVDTYKFWSTYTPQDIHLTGIFFDDSVATWDTTSSPYMSSIAAHAHAANLSVTLNPGTLADDGFFTIAENVVVVEDGFVGGVPPTTRPQSSTIMHDFPGSAAAQSSLITEILDLGFAGLYITTDGYESESALWMSFVGEVERWLVG